MAQKSTDVQRKGVLEIAFTDVCTLGLVSFSAILSTFFVSEDGWFLFHTHSYKEDPITYVINSCAKNVFKMTLTKAIYAPQVSCVPLVLC